MVSRKETVEFVLEKFGNEGRFRARAMFGEYALYADGKAVALICDDQLFVKIVAASEELEGICEKSEPYPGAKLHYVAPEDQLSKLPKLPDILLAVAASLPMLKKKKPKRGAN
jgi:TfoX/Sxy family transcriptional regulator of competence genes